MKKNYVRLFAVLMCAVMLFSLVPAKANAVALDGRQMMQMKDISYDDALALLDVVIENTIFTSMSANDMLSALDLALDLKGTEIEQIRMPIDGTYEPMPVAGMATQQIDWLANRDALHTFLLDSFVVVEDE